MTGQIVCKCPTCGADFTAERPRVDLGSNIFICSTGAARLRPQAAEVASMLAAKYPDTVRIERLIAGLYGCADGPEQPVRVVYVLLSNLRRTIDPLGWTVANVHGVGWALVKAEGRAS